MGGVIPTTGHAFEPALGSYVTEFTAVAHITGSDSDHYMYCSDNTMVPLHRAALYKFSYGVHPGPFRRDRFIALNASGDVEEIRRHKNHRRWVVIRESK